MLEPGGMRTDWAGSSMTIPPISAPYEQTVGRFAELLRTRADQFISEPARVARIVADLAGRDDAPLRLLLGTDAVRYAGVAARQLAESDARWRQVSESTAA